MSAEAGPGRRYMRSHLRTGLCLTGLVVVAWIGCATRPPAVNAEQAAALRMRAEAHFQRGFYLKPAETSIATPQAWQLAPLFIIEAAEPPAPRDLPIPAARPLVFFQSGHTLLNGRPHEQMTYWWAYPQASPAKRDTLSAQGVRITLDSAGQPVIWETLADTSDAQIMFVAQSLEMRALREFGAPLAGRRFAIERALADAPKVLVARVIEDGPVTMGPIVYLRAGTRDVTTVICRCMEAQVRELVGQQEYDLVGSKPTRILIASDVAQRLRLPREF